MNEYWPLIGQDRSRDLSLASDWLTHLSPEDALGVGQLVAPVDGPGPRTSEPPPVVPGHLKTKPSILGSECRSFILHKIRTNFVSTLVLIMSIT